MTLFTKDLADKCGKPVATLITWRNRYSDFPQPKIVRGRLIWKQSDVKKVKEWMRRNGR